jgi:hypothetical protein
MSKSLRRSFILVLLALGVAPLSAATPIGSAETNTAGITVDLMALERKGGVLTLKWAVHNKNQANTWVTFLYNGKDARTYLIDQERGTKYFVLTDKEGKAVASMNEYYDGAYGVRDHLEAGATRRYWAKYPAPPPEVKTLTVLFDGTEPFEDAPITEK